VEAVAVVVHKLHLEIAVLVLVVVAVSLTWLTFGHATLCCLLPEFLVVEVVKTLYYL